MIKYDKTRNNLFPNGFCFRNPTRCCYEVILWKKKKSPQKQDNRTMLTEQCLPVAKHIATNRATARDPSISEKNVQNFHQRQRNEYN